ncbi:hypothetical protein MMC14_008473 [Varicellaria rhodocarpa]|nr:hypothetical protein [Varicellaria rhodocarpa]
MFFSKVTALAILSLATNCLVSAQSNSYGDIYAREAYPDSYGSLSSRSTGLYARDAEPEYSDELYARAKGPKVTVSLSKGKGGNKNKWGTNKTKETESDGVALVEEACEKHGWNGAVITAAFHTSGGETEKHVDFIPDGRNGETAHVTKSGIVTIGAGGKGALRRWLLHYHHQNYLVAREAYANALDMDFD